MKFTNFCTSLLAAASLMAGAAAGTIYPRANIEFIMDDPDVKKGNTLDSMYTIGMETCITLTAFGKTGKVQNRKVAAHIAAWRNFNKNQKFINEVSQMGYEQGGLRIHVVVPHEDYVDTKVSLDEGFKNDLERMPGGIDGFKSTLQKLIDDALAKAKEAVRVSGGDDSHVSLVRLASLNDDDLGAGQRGKVEMDAMGHLTVEGREVDDDGEVDD